MIFPAFDPARRIERHIWRRNFCTLQRSSSFGWLAIGVKSSMAASNLEAMSDNEVIVAWGGLLTVD